MSYLNAHFYGTDFGCTFRTGVLRWIGDVHSGRAVVTKVTLSSGVHVAIATAVRSLDTGQTVSLTLSSSGVQVGPRGTVCPCRASCHTVSSWGTGVT